MIASDSPWQETLAKFIGVSETASDLRGCTSTHSYESTAADRSGVWPSKVRITAGGGGCVGLLRVSKRPRRFGIGVIVRWLVFRGTRWPEKAYVVDGISQFGLVPD